MIKEYDKYAIIHASVMNKTVVLVAANESLFSKRILPSSSTYAVGVALDGISISRVNPAEIFNGFISDRNPSPVMRIEEKEKIGIAATVSGKLIISDDPNEMVEYLVNSGYLLLDFQVLDIISGNMRRLEEKDLRIGLEKVREKMEKKRLVEKRNELRRKKVEKEAKKMAEEMVKDG